MTIRSVYAIVQFSIPDDKVLLMHVHMLYMYLCKLHQLHPPRYDFRLLEFGVDHVQENAVYQI